MRTARDRQVRRALAAERSRQRRSVDAEVEAIRAWIRRAIPCAMVLNVALIGVEIWQGIYGAIAANLTSLPMLWLARWSLRMAEQRDADDAATRAWAAVSDEHAAAAVLGAQRPSGPAVGAASHQAPRDCLYVMGDPYCQVCGRPIDGTGAPTASRPVDDDDFPF